MYVYSIQAVLCAFYCIYFKFMVFVRFATFVSLVRFDKFKVQLFKITYRVQLS